MDAQRRQGEGFPTSIVAHGEEVSCVAGRKEGEAVVDLLYNDDEDGRRRLMVIWDGGSVVYNNSDPKGKGLEDGEVFP